MCVDARRVHPGRLQPDHTSPRPHLQRGRGPHLRVGGPRRGVRGEQEGPQGIDSARAPH